MIVVAEMFAAWLAINAVVAILSWWSSRGDATARAKVLELLSDDSWWYGLNLVKASDGVLKRGTIYFHLGRLEEEGLVLSLEELTMQPEIGIKRRLFRISKLGREQLEAT